MIRLEKPRPRIRVAADGGGALPLSRPTRRERAALPWGGVANAPAAWDRIAGVVPGLSMRPGEPAPGLLAGGNAAANAFGWADPSGGGTLANALTFGYRAGRCAAAQPARAL